MIIKLHYLVHSILNSQYKFLMYVITVLCFYILYYKSGLAWCMYEKVGTEEELLQINKELLESNLKYAERLSNYQRMIAGDLIQVGEFKTNIKHLESENFKLREQIHKLLIENSNLRISKEVLQNEIGSLKRNLIPVEKEPCVSGAPSDILEPIKKRTKK